MTPIMNGIIIDTSSILFALSNKVDIFKAVEEQSPLEALVSEGVIKELAGIAGSSKSNSKYAGVALELIKRYQIKIERNSNYVDKWILGAAKRYMNVCTNDTRLKKALRVKGITVYSISRNGILR
jgi:rRNA-processing protein FCF1